MHNRLQKAWQMRILSTMMVGYAGFYLIRQNVFLALRDIQQEFHFSDLDYGLIISVFNLLYGISKGMVGIISDRCNARYFMAIGLFFACLANLCLVFCRDMNTLIILCAANAVFQSMGWPACAKLLNHWFTRQELGTKWAVWNMSQQLGSLAMYACGAFAIYKANWRIMFLIPSLLGLGIVAFIFKRLRDTPESVGLPTINKENCDDAEGSFKAFLIAKVYANPRIWLVCMANFCLYFVRMALISWAPKFLSEYKGNIKMAAVTHTAIYEIAGMVGGLVAGRLSDQTGDRGKISMIFMSCVTIAVWSLWRLPTGTPIAQFLVMMCIGFFISGPQILIGVAASDFASKKAAGAATGLTGIIGYMGGTLAGLGLGYVLQHWGWNNFFLLLLSVSACGVFFLFLTQRYYRSALDVRMSKL